MEKNIQEIQKSILRMIFSGDFDYREINFIDIVIFGKYNKIYETVKKIPKEDLKKDGYTNLEFAKLGLNDFLIEIISSDYFSVNPYKDIEYLCKTMLLSNEHITVDKKLINFKKLESYREELFKRMSGWEAKEYSLDNVFDTAYSLSLTAKNKKGILGYYTGIKSLDKYTDGLQKGTVMRLTAYSNIGKSKLSYHVCNSILDQGAKVLYFSLEVKKEFVLYNLLCNRYGLNFGDVARGCWHDMDISDMSKDLEIIDDKYELDKILLYAESRKPDVIFIDFVQNIRTDARDEYSSMTEVAIKIQQLAIKHNIAVFDLSQISNDGTKYELGDVIKSKGSGALVASADIGLVMQRDKGTNRNILFISKNKFGTNTKALDLEFNFSTGQIKDLGEHLTKSLTI